jgi:ADP-ribosylglycohydrolase
MFGAIAGDVIGSPYEFHNYKGQNFPLFPEKPIFTDDTVLTFAIADAFMNKKDYAISLKEYARRYIGVGYGPSFKKWAYSDNMLPYNSWGNGSAMRVSSIG